MHGRTDVVGVNDASDVERSVSILHALLGEGGVAGRRRPLPLHGGWAGRRREFSVCGIGERHTHRTSGGGVELTAGQFHWTPGPGRDLLNLHIRDSEISKTQVL